MKILKFNESFTIDDANDIIDIFTDIDDEYDIIESFGDYVVGKVSLYREIRFTKSIQKNFTQIEQIEQNINIQTVVMNGLKRLKSIYNFRFKYYDNILVIYFDVNDKFKKLIDLLGYDDSYEIEIPFVIRLSLSKTLGTNVPRSLTLNLYFNVNDDLSCDLEIRLHNRYIEMAVIISDEMKNIIEKEFEKYGFNFVEKFNSDNGNIIFKFHNKKIY